MYALAPPRVRSKRRSQFPIFDEECEFKVLSPPLIKGLTTDERTLIERVQPYAASQIPADDPLAILRKVSNRDKHHLLITMVAALSETNSWVTSDNANVRFTYLVRGLVEDGTKIVAFTATPKDPTADMHVNPQSGLRIQIAKTGASFDVGAVEILDMIHHHVRHMILESWFERGYMPRTWAEIQASQQP